VGSLLSHGGERHHFEGITAEEALLVTFAHRRQEWVRKFSITYWLREASRDDRRQFESWIYFMPWEKARLERASRLTLVAALVASEGLQDERAQALARLVNRQRSRDATFDLRIWNSLDGVMDGRRQIQTYLNTVARALDNWHRQHGTLPESLEDMIGVEAFDRVLLEQIPVHPFTGAPMEYRRNAPAPEGIDRHRDITIYLGQSTHRLSWQERQAYINTFFQSGGTYLRLGRWVYLIVGERSQEEEDRSQEEGEER